MKKIKWSSFENLIKKGKRNFEKRGENMNFFLLSFHFLSSATSVFSHSVSPPSSPQNMLKRKQKENCNWFPFFCFFFLFFVFILFGFISRVGSRIFPPSSFYSRSVALWELSARPHLSLIWRLSNLHICISLLRKFIMFLLFKYFFSSLESPIFCNPLLILHQIFFLLGKPLMQPRKLRS